MKYLDEYRDAAIVRGLAGRIRDTATRPWSLMEMCGGQTHTIVKQGLDVDSGAKFSPDGKRIAFYA
jgi:hydrogenase expression/formation protein HypD